MNNRTFFFEVTSSSTGEVYEIHVDRTGTNLTCTCSCPAGQNRTACKHRLGILQGDPAGVTGGDLEAIHQIPALLVGTDVERAMRSLHALGDEMQTLKKKIFGAKKALARTLDD